MSSGGKSGSASALLMVRFSSWTICFGVPAGASTPHQPVLTKPGTVSLIAGTSGNDLTRVGWPTPSIFRRPVLTNGNACGGDEKEQCICPDMRSIMAGPPPL